MIRSVAILASVTFFVTPNVGFGRRGQQLTCFPTSLNGVIMHWTSSKKLESLHMTSRRYSTVCGIRVSWRNSHLLASKETCIAGLHLSCQIDKSLLYLMAPHHRQSIYPPESPRGVILVLYFFLCLSMIWLYTYRTTSTYSLMILHSILPLRIHAIECDLNKFKGWADSWCVTFNASKTEEMIISRKRSQNHPPLHFMNKDLSLQIVLLFWVPPSPRHCPGHNLLPQQAPITIYKAYIRPFMEYASPIWNGAGTTSLKLLDRLQKKAFRLLKIDEPLKFGIVPLSHRRNVASLCVFYRHISLQPSIELADILPSEAPSMRATRSSLSGHPHCVCIPR